jgi:hypothetical protein
MLSCKRARWGVSGGEWRSLVDMHSWSSPTTILSTATRGGKSPRDHSVPRIGIPGVASGQVVIFGPVIGASGFWGLTSWTQALRSLGRDDPVVGGLYGPIESGEDAGCQPSGSFRWPT